MKKIGPQVPSSQKNQRNQAIEFSWDPWEFHCLVVLFLLLYVICASLPTEVTQKKPKIVLIKPELNSFFSCFSLYANGARFLEATSTSLTETQGINE